MKRKFYLMVEGVEDKYAERFFERFGEDLKKEKAVITKLRKYEEVYGDYIVIVDTRNLESRSIKIIKTRKFEEKMEKCMVGIYLPDNLQEFLKLCERETSLIEAGEGRDAVTGKIFIREKRGEKEHYLEGPLLHRMRGALAEEIPLDKVLKY